MVNSDEPEADSIIIALGTNARAVSFIDEAVDASDFAIARYADFAEAREAIAERAPDVALVLEEGARAKDIVVELRRSAPDTPVVLVGDDPDALAELSFLFNACHFLTVNDDRDATIARLKLIVRRAAKRPPKGETRQAWLDESRNALWNALPVAIFIIDEDGRLQEFSYPPDAEHFIEKEEVRGKQAAQFFPRELIEGYVAALERAVRGGGTADFEYTLPIGGETSFFIARVSPLPGGGSVVASIDLTAQRRAEEGFRVSLEKYRALFETFPMGVLVYDEEGEIVEANDRAERIFGTRRVDMATKRLTDFVKLTRPDGSPMPGEELPAARALNENRLVADVEFGVVRKDGETVWVAATASPLAGGASGVAMAAMDVTAKRWAAEALKRSERQFRTVWERAFDGMRIIDDDGVVVLVNKAFCDMVKLPRERLTGSPFTVVYEEKYRDYILRQYHNRVAADKVELFYEKRIRLWNGQEVWYELSNSYLDFAPKSRRLLSVFREITDRKIAEEKLEVRERYYRQLLDAIPDVVFVKNRKSEIVWANRAFRENYPGRPSQVVAVTDPTGKDKERVERERGFDELAFRKGENVRAEETRTLDDGETIYISTVRNPLRDENGKIVEMVGVSRDISELKLVERRLRELNAAKDKFFSIIAHDLRSPMTSLLGYIDHLLDDHETLAPEERVDALTKIRKSAALFHKLLEDLLRWSRSQLGRLALEPKPVKLEALVERVLDVYADNAANRRIDLFSQVSPGVTCLADEETTTTVLRNLVSNALKFTPAGGSVVIRVKAEEGAAVTEVRDTGVGVDPERLEQLFQIDTTVATLGVDGEKGAGLGLVLCKEFVEKNGGKIWATSKPGKGSVFAFTLPLYDAEIN
jgi:PAS domain S-box-containing protein